MSRYAVHYGASDVLALRKFIDGVDRHAFVILYYEKVVLEIRNLMERAMPTKDTVNDVLAGFLKKYGTKAALKFIFEVPLEDIPLYVNDPDVQQYVKWRLTIRK